MEDVKYTEILMTPESGTSINVFLFFTSIGRLIRCVGPAVPPCIQGFVLVFEHNIGEG